MVIQDRIYTADDLWAISNTPENDGKRYDLIEGVLYEMSPAGGPHGALTNDLNFYITLFVKQHQLGRVMTAETGFILFRNPRGRDTVLAPDIGFVTAARMPAKLPPGFVPFAPDLAVEVVSPGNTPKEISGKVTAYLRYGTREVWVVYPEDEWIHIYRSSGEAASATVEFLTRDDILNGVDLLPGFTLPLSPFFASLP